MTRVETIGDCTLYLGDCLEIMPTLGKVDAVVTDPPYGMNIQKYNMGKSNNFQSIEWDKKRPSGKTLSDLRFISTHQIIWGGQYFSDSLPQAPKWLIWDKKTAGITSFADCELAWTNLDGCARMFRFLWSGPYMDVHQKRLHPTQKPLQLMDWCLTQVPNAESIFDPFMGSGTTGAACAKMGRKFTGIELDEGYFDIACKRIEETYRKPHKDPKP